MSRQRLPVTEQHAGAFTKPLRVDREKGVVYGVKVLGWTSANRREYLKEAAIKAVRAGLYENVKVYIDHRTKPNEQRSARDLFGKLCNATVEADGVYADLWYNRKNKMAEDVAEDAERGLGLYGLSHDAEAGDYDVRPDGVQVIKEISVVNSVDIVADAATVSSLSEGRTVSTPTKITIGALLERLSVNAKLPKPLRKQLLEMDTACPREMDDPGDMPADAGATPTDPKAALAAAVSQLVQSADAADHELAQKIMKLLKPEAPVEEEDGEDDDEEDGEGDGKPFGKEGKGMRARRPAPRKPAAPRPAVVTEARAKALIALAGVAESRELLDAVTGIDETRAISVIQLAKGKQTQAQRTPGPRSAPAGTVSATATVTESKIPDDSKALASWLNGK